mmetsp:Transcript_45853/g.129740  ORF Transcript_45853/g.129740 Transcript_45853/m.129740 type:complete len:287 (-) Transcript_45853:300-1160(-)
MLGRRSSSALASLSCAGFMSGVWNAPEVLITLACRAPAVSASSLSFMTAFSVPAHENPLGKSSFVSWQTASFPSNFWASAQRSMTFTLSRPATDRESCLVLLAATCIASPRIFTSFSPSSNVKTPAAQSAVYSPDDRPAMHWHRVTASSRSMRSLCKAAMPAMNMMGWQCCVSSSLDSGPCRQSSSTSKPRMAFAVSSISLTTGRSFTVDIIFTYCEPCPGNSSPIGKGFWEGAAAIARLRSSSSSPSIAMSAEPYLFGSRPCVLAAPGRLMYHVLSGFLPHSQLL